MCWIFLYYNFPRVVLHSHCPRKKLSGFGLRFPCQHIHHLYATSQIHHLSHIHLFITFYQEAHMLFTRGYCRMSLKITPNTNSNSWIWNNCFILVINHQNIPCWVPRNRSCFVSNITKHGWPYWKSNVMVILNGSEYIWHSFKEQSIWTLFSCSLWYVLFCLSKYLRLQEQCHNLVFRNNFHDI